MDKSTQWSDRGRDLKERIEGMRQKKILKKDINKMMKSNDYSLLNEYVPLRDIHHAVHSYDQSDEDLFAYIRSVYDQEMAVYDRMDQESVSNMDKSEVGTMIVDVLKSRVSVC